MGYFERLKNIYSNQKSGDIYYRYFTRFISAPITALISFTSITPNMATLSMFFFGFIGSIFLSLGNAYYYILGGLFFQLLIVADTVDGELARFNGTSSLFGDYFDRLAHYATNPLCIIGIGASLYSNTQEIAIFYFAVFAMICYLLDDISRDLLISHGLSNEATRKDSKSKMAILPKSRIKAFFSNTGSNTAFFHLIVLVAIIDIIIIDIVSLQNDYFVSHTYMIYFLLLTVIKFFLRIPLIWRLKNI